ncbi:MAG: hypothetical protein HY291_01230 [Planctomycetes bacterium]|nr:hypothetical protein [Planctomycetota bacterium]
MRETFYTAIGYLFMLAAIVFSFKLYKWHERAVIEANDHSMEPEYRNSSYPLDSSPQHVSDLKLDSAVAYYLPGSNTAYRIAWVVAKEGQHVVLTGGKVMVDGHPSQAKVLGFTVESPEFIVPRDCVFVVACAPEDDSLKYGPVPMRNIKGMLK